MYYACAAGTRRALQRGYSDCREADEVDSLGVE